MSKFFEGEDDRVRDIQGTPYYYAPEMINDSGSTIKKEKVMLGRQIDIWCLGVTLYQIASG